jgi:hypothetical protein
MCPHFALLLLASVSMADSTTAKLGSDRIEGPISASVQGALTIRYVPDLSMIFAAVDGVRTVSEQSSQLAKLPIATAGDGFVDGIVRFGLVTSTLPPWSEKTFPEALLIEHEDQFQLEAPGGFSLTLKLVSSSVLDQCADGPDCLLVNAIGVSHFSGSLSAQEALDGRVRIERAARIRALAVEQAASLGGPFANPSSAPPSIGAHNCMQAPSEASVHLFGASGSDDPQSGMPYLD